MHLFLGMTGRRFGLEAPSLDAARGKRSVIFALPSRRCEMVKSLISIGIRDRRRCHGTLPFSEHCDRHRNSICDLDQIAMVWRTPSAIRAVRSIFAKGLGMELVVTTCAPRSMSI